MIPGLRSKDRRGIGRIVAVTGHRGCGITSTAVNVASEAGKRGLSALIVDMNIDYRSANMYCRHQERYPNRCL
ncbi:hypothetical protein [Paenibacillus rhizophilus]|uniref:CobQ/CobB/MinD/ParA nucleotide binding domain-containing protein n=1 Tax=Paenibacillus rhizophilus TaxID=1850366 RepID=A0A3N9P3B4_9BACL|nr:hypothetical protein [Paenibacillus rhizophilus]RQW09574.1 hypothetical protein EH198_19060 [Paenibacillus rhizophilus]